MIKITCLILLMLSFGKYGFTQTANYKTVSIDSQEILRKNIIKLQKINDFELLNKNVYEFLNLNKWNLKSIPLNTIESNAIKHFSLHDNFLEKIPHDILKHLPYLSYLNLSRNDIILYESNELKHENLQVLDLSYQNMSKVNNLIPDVDVFDNNADDKYTRMIFDSAKMHLPNLKFLDLSGNDIATLLWNFNLSFPQLLRLDLANINGLILDPNFFKKIPTSLRVVHFENNYFNELNLPTTAELTELYLDGNPLKYFNVTSAKLEILSLSNCKNLHKIYLNTPYLRQLDLSKNNLHEKEFVMNYDVFRTLRVLLLDYNNFSYFFTLHDMQWLNELSMSYNKIRFFEPDSFKYLRFLKKLSLKGNEINNIETATFEGLDQLECLDLSYNQLTHLFPDWAFPLKKLQYLNVQSNKFPTISDIGIYSISSLQHLLVMNNNFSEVTTLELEPLPNFITVYLA